MSPGRFRPVLTAVLALLLYALLIDTAIETYQSRSPAGVWVAIPVALYVSFMLWLLRQRGANRPGLQTTAWVSSFLFLALLAFTVTLPDGLAHGMRVAGYSTSVVLSATTIGLIAFALVVVTASSSLWPVLRVLVLLAGGYGIAGFVTGIAGNRGYVQLLQGHSAWERAPYFLQGAFVGGLVVLPLAFVLELGLGMARAQFRGRWHRLLAFALGAFIAYSGFTAGG